MGVEGVLLALVLPPRRERIGNNGVPGRVAAGSAAAGPRGFRRRWCALVRGWRTWAQSPTAQGWGMGIGKHADPLGTLPLHLRVVRLWSSADGY